MNPKRKVLTYPFRGGELRATGYSESVTFGVYSNTSEGPIASFRIPRITCREFSAAVASAVRELRREAPKGRARANQGGQSASTAGATPDSAPACASGDIGNPQPTESES